MFEFAEYAERAAATAVYPQAKQDVELAYLTLGLVEEAQEFVWAKRGGQERAAELGDFCWYLAMLARALRLEIEHNADPPLTAVTLTEAAAAIAGTVKRIYRDEGGAPSETQRMILRGLIREALARAEHEARTLDCSLADVWVANLAKLADRKRRNALHGKGDHR